MSSGLNNLFSLAERRAQKGIVSQQSPKPWELSRCSNENARKRLPYESAKKYEALPLYVLGSGAREKLYVALSDALTKAEHIERAQALRFISGMEISVVPTASKELEEAIFLAYHSSDEKFMALVEKLSLTSHAHGQDRETPLSIDPHASEADIPQFLCAILDYAIAQQASDVHITARAQGSYLKIRCQGSLRESVHAACTLAQHKQLINRVRVLCRLKMENPFQAQDGSFLYPCAGVERCLRVSILPSFFGENCVIRIPEQSALRELSELGLSQFSVQHLRQCIERQEGLMLFTGPTGSGKTTLMYACLLEAAKQGLHIISLEDPIERVVPGVTQVSVRDGQGLNFPQALRACLRQDPDVIMLGEIRDKESATQCIQAAITGHLVLATLHARDILHVPARLLQLGLQEELVLQSLDMIINQRLVPQLCEDCKKLISRSEALYSAPGCLSCHWTGKGSRQILEEVFVFDEGIREVLGENMSSWSKKFLRNYVDINFLSAQTKLFDWLHSGKIDQETLRRFADTFSL